MRSTWQHVRGSARRHHRSCVSTPSRWLSAQSADTTPVIISVARTPIGSFMGSLSSFKASELGTIALQAAVSRAGIDAAAIQEVYLGNVLQAGQRQAPARQAALRAGLAQSTPCTTVNKVCASGTKALMFAAQSIRLGDQSVIAAGGFESMSNAPHYLLKARSGIAYGHGEVSDAVLYDGLWDAFDDHHMGMCGEDTAAKHGISRADQDAFAVASYERAIAAQEAGAFADEIIPVTVSSRKGDTVVDRDEEPYRAKFEKFPTLRPAFKKDGTITAANASSINDGAAALIVTSASKAAELGVKPIARILGYGDAARAPIDFPTAPTDAVKRAIAHAGLDMKDVDLHEINEAFSVVVLANMENLGLDHDKVNVLGGAVSIGHPIGASGARIVGTLLSALKAKDRSIGCASICNGGGGASALVLERL